MCISKEEAQMEEERDSGSLPVEHRAQRAAQSHESDTQKTELSSCP